MRCSEGKTREEEKEISGVVDLQKRKELMRAEGK